MKHPLVRVRNLERHFGLVQAVDHLSFDIEAGQVVGFIGANGSGKTTTMRMMATLEIPNAGTITIDGFDTQNHPSEVRQRIGWMPDHYGAYDHMSVLEYLDFYARAFGFKGKERQQRVEEVMEFTNLGPIAAHPINKLSKGMAQRACLGRTLLHDPPLLILDEPAAGLDPKARVEFKHLVRLLAQEGKTLFISSHILSELGEMCDTLLFIDRGRLVHHGSTESLTDGAASSASTHFVEVRLSGSSNPGSSHDPNASLQEWALLQPSLQLAEVTRRGAVLKIEDASPEALSALLARMIREGLPVCEFFKKEQRLEEVFIDLLEHPKAPVAIVPMSIAKLGQPPSYYQGSLASSAPEPTAQPSHTHPASSHE